MAIPGLFVTWKAHGKREIEIIMLKLSKCDYHYIFIIIEIVKIRMMRPPEKVNASNEASFPDSVKRCLS